VGEGRGEREEEKRKSVLVEVVDGIEDGTDGGDGDRVVLSKRLSLRDAVKELYASDTLKGEVVLCARLEAKPNLS